VVDRGIGNARREHHSKTELLLFIEREEITGLIQLQSAFGLSTHGAKSRITSALLVYCGLESSIRPLPMLDAPQFCY
jgi:hypothetical protein